ncbi:MAG: riboflavin synthase [Bacteroidetes bacterium]|nr:riboflavin synthase [Bacteroidota bacterium]
MFTGIVTAMGTVQSVIDEGDRVLRIGAEWDCSAIPIGASIAHSGVCLTVISCDKTGYEIAASAETMRVTTLGDWKIGDQVNLERALCVGDELGGHIVSGHVDGIASVISVEAVGDSHCVWLRAPDALARFVAPKGSVALDGVSLTVNEVKESDFSVNVIAHTWSVTTLGQRVAGEPVNMEIDMLARYVARLAESGADES